MVDVSDWLELAWLQLEAPAWVRQRLAKAGMMPALDATWQDLAFVSDICIAACVELVLLQK